MSKRSKSIYRQTLNEVSSRVSRKRNEAQQGDKPISFAAECNTYAIECGYKNWSSLAEDMKKEDKDNGICWNCNDIDDSLIRVCTECGRKGTDKSGKFTIRNSRVSVGAKK